MQEDLYTHIKKYTSNRPGAEAVWQFFLSHKEFLFEIENEINQAVDLFNHYREGEKIYEEDIPLPSSSLLKQTIKGQLPKVQTLIQTIRQHHDPRLIENIVKKISEFDFIDTLNPVDTCAAAVLLGSYRSTMLILYPYLEEHHVQIASALDEMIAVMMLKGQHTKLFDGVKLWYADLDEEGFSKELSDKLKENHLL